MKSKINYLLFFIVLILWNTFVKAQGLQKKYPDVMLSDDYGILNESDILYDIHKHGRGALAWQCFKVKDVKFRYETWEDRDPEGLINNVTNLYDYSFIIRGNPFDQVYIDRRAVNDYTFWKYRYKPWKRLSKKQKYICFSGDPVITKGKEITWSFNKMKSLNGCFSYFEGDCNISVSGEIRKKEDK